MLEKQREEMEKLQALEVNGRIHFGELPVLEPRDCIKEGKFELAESKRKRSTWKSKVRK